MEKSKKLEVLVVIIGNICVYCINSTNYCDSRHLKKSVKFRTSRLCEGL